MAVIVTVDVTGCDPPLPPLPPLADPPQPLAKTNTDAASIMRTYLERRFLGAAKQKKMAASTAWTGIGIPSRSSDPLNFVVEIVRVVEAAPVLGGVTVEGENRQDAPVGSPEQLKVTAA